MNKILRTRIVLLALFGFYSIARMVTVETTVLRSPDGKQLVALYGDSHIKCSEATAQIEYFLAQAKKATTKTTVLCEVFQDESLYSFLETIEAKALCSLGEMERGVYDILPMQGYELSLCLECQRHIAEYFGRNILAIKAATEDCARPIIKPTDATMYQVFSEIDKHPFLYPNIQVAKIDYRDDLSFFSALLNASSSLLAFVNPTRFFQQLTPMLTSGLCERYMRQNLLAPLYDIVEQYASDGTNDCITTIARECRATFLKFVLEEKIGIMNMAQLITDTMPTPRDLHSVMDELARSCINGNHENVDTFLDEKIFSEPISGAMVKIEEQISQLLNRIPSAFEIKALDYIFRQKANNPRVAVLAGCLHTQELTKVLKKEGYSVVYESEAKFTEARFSLSSLLFQQEPQVVQLSDFQLLFNDRFTPPTHVKKRARARSWKQRTEGLDKKRQRVV